MNIRKPSSVAIAAVGLIVAGSAFGQARTYNFNDRDITATPVGGCNVAPATSGAFTGTNGNTVGCREVGNSGASTLGVTAWSNDGAGSSYRTGAVNDQSGNGFGITNQSETTGSPNHAADNTTPGGADLFLLNFTTAQALKSVTVGWTYEDGDFQVLRWGGTGSVTSIAGKTAATLLSDGWVLMNGVQNGLGCGVGCTTGNDTNQTFNINASELTSSSWIISAYNSSLGGTGATSYGIDAIKLLGVTTNSPTPTTPVPIPGTLALASFGLLFAGVGRRRNAA